MQTDFIWECLNMGALRYVGILMASGESIWGSIITFVSVCIWFPGIKNAFLSFWAPIYSPFKPL